MKKEPLPSVWVVEKKERGRFIPSLDCCAQPHMIRMRFGLPEVGDVPEEMAMQTERRCVAIYESARAKYRGRHTGCCFPLADGSYPRTDGGCSNAPDVMVMHSFDREVVAQGVSFPCPETGGRARERMKL